MNVMMNLLDLLDGWQEAPWVPLYKPFGVTLASLIVPDRCRDCGLTMTYMHQGGSHPAIGSFFLCDDCATLDGCLSREHERPDWHVSRWGVWHPETEHDELSAAREKRRANYLRKVAA